MFAHLRDIENPDRIGLVDQAFDIGRMKFSICLIQRSPGNLFVQRNLLLIILFGVWRQTYIINLCYVFEFKRQKTLDELWVLKIPRVALNLTNKLIKIAGMNFWHA